MAEYRLVFHLVLLAVCMALFLSVLVLWPIGALVNRWKGESGGTSHLPRLGRWRHHGPVCLR